MAQRAHRVFGQVGLQGGQGVGQLVALVQVWASQEHPGRKDHHEEHRKTG